MVASDSGARQRAYDRRREIQQPGEKAWRRTRVQDRGTEAAQSRAPVAKLGVHPGCPGRRAGVVPSGTPEDLTVTSFMK
jgi:hypothetical protein